MIIGGLVVALIVFRGIFGGASTPSAPRVAGPTDDGARSVCKSFMEQTLRAPATAKFSRWTDQKVIKTSTGQYTVSGGYVDAENAFGANIRTYFACDVEHIVGEQWRLIDLATAP